MSRTQQSPDARVRAENIGGIESTDVTLEPGVTILTGRNATNRTSFLRGLVAACGSDRASLKSDAERGSVTVEIGETTYTRYLSRTGDSVRFEGDPALDDSTTADLFAFLLASNEARRAVVTGADLREIIMRPVDTESIEAEIDRLETERRRVEREIETLDSLDAEIRRLDSREDELRREIDELEAQRDELRAIVDGADDAVDDQRERRTELEGVLGRLQTVRSDLERTRFRLETERESLSSLRGERSDLERELDGVEVGDANTDDLASKADRLRGQIDELNNGLTDLRAIIEYNTDVLDGKADVVDDALGPTSDGESVTNRLVDSDSITCWTCGSDVDRRQVTRTTERLRELATERRSRRSELRSELESVEQRITEAQRRRTRRDDLESRLGTVEAEIDSRTESVEELKGERARLADEVESLERETEALRDDARSDILDAHRELSEVEFEIDQRRDEVETVARERAAKRRAKDRREELRAERDDLAAALTEERTRIEDVETEAIDAFNREMETLLDLLGYDNVERVWLERVERTVARGRRSAEETRFDLHVVRESSDGAVYEDAIDHLSESERKVVGLVFALAGYLVHDVHETVPFILLDSLEAVDAARIATLVDYFEQFPTYLVVALLPEDAAALDDEYARIHW
jgi:DNA repair exonuclease SbcCD ATPase subunit